MFLFVIKGFLAFDVFHCKHIHVLVWDNDEHMQHLVRIPCVRVSCIRCHTCNTVSSVNSTASPKMAGRRSMDSQRVNFSHSYLYDLKNFNSSSVLEQSKHCENVLSRRPHWPRSCSGEMLVVESLDGGPNLFGQFLEEALVEDGQVPHERNFMHHVGSCLALLSLQSTGNTNVSILDPRYSARLQRYENQLFGGQSHTCVRLQKFRQVGQCDKTALCQGSNRKQLQHHTCTVVRSREQSQARHWPRVRTVVPMVL